MESSIPRIIALLALVSIAGFGVLRAHGGADNPQTTAGKIMWQYDTGG